MPKVSVAHKPDLTRDAAQALFASHFAGTYSVHPFSGPFRDFVVEKNAFTGVAVKLEQTATETRFVYNGLCPKWWARALMGPLFGLFLWRGITKEVGAYIESEPAFH